ncbi:MAG: ribosome biogenesis GTPase Der [Deltaproteobacteria bacterium]|nr:ribosome biogenesis GTPase Der [Deltaproteobacteria bacterium]NCP03809.1 ribosome biogenesis GTPase Der [Deltaproteobacteria bacterium]NCP78644.1 ribosome biogenesis GTPase Der [Desulfuromonadales bacterium]
MLPVVAIVGRPNVGKSTLFNRILGQRKALVEDFAGVTRDRNYAEVTRYAKPFLLIDTGGFEPASSDRLLTQMREQSQLAVEEADLIILLMDVREGLTPSDMEVAQMLRKVKKPVLLVVNKVDGDKQEDDVAEFYALGIAQIYTLSSAHGRGVGELIDDLLELLPTRDMPEIASEVRMAVIGRPNVGKSSLVNRILGSERMVANPTAGTTRDSVDTPFEFESQRYVLIDTAGIRRKGKVSQTLEKFSAVQALKAMDRAHVVLMLIDAAAGVTDQDLAVAGYAYERGRALILVVNKWDLPEKDTHSMKNYLEEIRRRFKFLPFVPVLFVSALSGQRVARIMPTVAKVFAEFNRKITTSELNSILAEAVTRHPPPMVSGRRIKLYYATQTMVRPPTFTIFTNCPEDIHFSYERYLHNALREAFGFEGVPLRLRYRGRTARQG